VTHNNTMKVELREWNYEDWCVGTGKAVYKGDTPYTESVGEETSIAFGDFDVSVPGDETCDALYLKLDKPASDVLDHVGDTTFIGEDGSVINGYVLVRADHLVIGFEEPIEGPGTIKGFVCTYLT